MDSSPPIAPRRVLRIPLPVQSFSGAGSSPRFLGYLANLSQTGAFVQCSAPRPVGTYMCLLLRLPEAPNREIQCSAEIVWTRGYAGTRGPCQGMGVRFVEIAEQAQRFLRRFCAEEEASSEPVPPPISASLLPDHPR